MLKKLMLRAKLYFNRLVDILGSLVGEVTTITTFYSVPFIEGVALYKVYLGDYKEALLCSIIAFIQILINIYIKKK